MKAFIVEGQNRAEIREVPIPELKEDEILCKVTLFQIYQLSLPSLRYSLSIFV